jgi:Protein of unknown function (DUF402)
LERGDLVTLEGRRRDGVLRWAFPHYVVIDRADLVALYIPVGSTGLATASREQFWGEADPAPFEWHSHDVLRLTPVGAWHSVDLFFTPGSGFAGWYVNFQAPLERIPSGFVTCDLELDIWVEPDRAWSWKDRVEFEQSVDLGRITSREAAAIESDARRVIARCEAADAPFGDEWIGWRPDAGWGAEALETASL